MSGDKKDLTRIEDLSEFIHELDDTEDFSTDLPDLPSSDDNSPFASETDINFGEVEAEAESSDEAAPFESAEFSSETFGAETSPTFGIEDNAFQSETPEWNTDFNTASSEPETSLENSTDSFNISDEDSLFPEPSHEVEATPEPEAKEEPSLFEESSSEPEPIKESEPEVYTPSPEYKTPETFEDLKKFSESSSFTGMATEGNPSFSILVKNVKFLEDVNDMISLLKEFNLLVDSEEQTKSRLMRGNLLIPRISEYAAIFMAHKLRRFDVDLQIGLSDEIYPPKHQETPETGIVSKHSLYQNQNHHFHFDDPKLEISQIIVAATPSLEGHQVIRYIGVASEHKILESHVVEDENSSDIPLHYQELAQKLKAHALKNNSNAVVGLNYQLTPIPSEYGVGGHKYRLTCTGNLVWVNKL